MVPRGEGAAVSTAGKAPGPRRRWVRADQPRGPRPQAAGGLPLRAAAEGVQPRSAPWGTGDPSGHRGELFVPGSSASEHLSLSPNHDGAHSDPVTHVNTPEPGGSEREVEPRG